MARSRVLLVVEMLPWVNCWATLPMVAPIPTWVELPAASEAAKTSANCAPACLKPTVPELDTLLLIASSALDAIESPLKPCWNAISVSA